MLRPPVSALHVTYTSLYDAPVQIRPQDTSRARQKPQGCSECACLHGGRGQADGQGKSSLNGRICEPSGADGPSHHQASEEASKILLAMKNLLYGTGDQEPQTELAALLAQEIYNHHLLLQMVTSLPKLEFEVRIAIFVFCAMIMPLIDTPPSLHIDTPPSRQRKM